jgi:lipoprotein-releasing system permease protein
VDRGRSVLHVAYFGGGVRQLLRGRWWYVWHDGVDGGPPNNWCSTFGGSAWEYEAQTGQYFLHLFDHTQADLNWDNPKVRAEVFKLMRFWRDKGVGGFRLDVINLISGISVAGVMTGTMALVIILSAFNGFDALVHSLFNAFDPDLKITPVTGKTFSDTMPSLQRVKALPEVMYATGVIEENALLQYGDRQYIATVKGVGDAYTKMSGIDTMIVDGKFELYEKGAPMAIVGQGIASNLGIGLHFITPIKVYVPRRGERVSLNPERAFNKSYIFPSGVFAIQQDFDLKYMIVPIAFARKLFGYDHELSAVEIKLRPGAEVQQVQEKIREILGRSFHVKDRYEQQALLYRTMKTEKWAIFLILTFILLIASFNVIGSL